MEEDDDNFALLYKFINYFNQKNNGENYYAKVIYLLKVLA